MNAPVLTPEVKRIALWLALTVGLLWLFSALSSILTPFLLAFILAYILNPGVEWLYRKRVPRALGVTLMLLLLMLVMVLMVLLLVIVVQREVPLLREQLPGLVDKVNAVVAPLLNELGIRVTFDFAGLRSFLTEHLASSPDEILGTLFGYLKTSGSAALSAIGIVFIVPILMFYLLMDWNMLVRRLEGFVPRRWVDTTQSLMRETDELLSQYLRGQLLVMIILAVFYSAGLAIAGFDIAIPVGVFTGLAVFIPYIGFALGLIMALVAAVLQFGDWYGLAAVAVVYGLGQFVESFYLTPRLVGERIGLHPLVVIFALLAFGQFFGFFGILLALPTCAILLVAARRVKQAYLASDLYRK